MDRRRFLGLLGAGTAGLIAGCGSASDGSAGSGTDADTPEPTFSPTQTPVATVGGVDLPVPRGELRTPLPEDTIPAIVDPAFGPDWSGIEAPEGAERPLLPEDAAVIGVARGGEARAYPLRILNWHEVVNDDLGGPLLVTYCVLCGSGIVAERTVQGRETRFGVSGKLWREDLVLYDEATESLWSQILAAAIRGPRVGDRLTQVPSTLTTLAEWRRRHPDTEVLLPPPASNTVRGRSATFDYFDDKYSYDGEQLIGFDYESENGVFARSLVVGISHDGVDRAYPFETVREAGVVNDRVAGLPVAVTTTPGGSLAAWVRRIDGQVLDFAVADDRHLRAGGSRWERATGRAVDGPFEGRTLAAANDQPPMFWTGWSNFHPDTEVYGQ